MTYSPKFAVLNPRKIGSNILAYIEANQGDALTYLESDIKPIKRFSLSVVDKTKPIFPRLAVISDDDQVEYGNDVITGGYTATFELIVSNPVPADAIANAKVLLLMICSLILNIPTADLIAGTEALDVVPEQIETAMGEIGGNEVDNPTNFFQVCQIRAAFSVSGGSRM